MIIKTDEIFLPYVSLRRDMWNASYLYSSEATFPRITPAQVAMGLNIGMSKLSLMCTNRNTHARIRLFLCSKHIPLFSLSQSC